MSDGVTGRTFESMRVSAATVRSDVCQITSIRAVIREFTLSQNLPKIQPKVVV